MATWVECATQAWGQLVQPGTNAPLANAVPQINTTVRASASDSGAVIAPADWRSNADGLLPGYVAEGTWLLIEPDGQSRQVEAVAGASVGRLTDSGGVVRTTQSLANHQNPTGPGSPTPAGSKATEIDATGNVLMGPNALVPVRTGNHNQTIADFLYAADTRRLLLRTLLLNELGDPPDLALSKASEPQASTSAAVTLPVATLPVVSTGDAFAASGELLIGGSQTITYTGKTATEFTGCAGGTGTFAAGTAVQQNAYPDGVATGVLATENLGTLYWRGWVTPAGGTPGVTKGGAFQGRSAQIYCRANENIFDGKTGGKLILAVTPNGKDSPVDAVTIENNGKVGFGQSSPTQGRIELAASTASTDGIAWGTDARMWRSAAGVLKTNATIHTDGDVIARQGTASHVRIAASGIPGILFGSAENVRLFEDAGTLNCNSPLKIANAWTGNADAPIDGYVTMVVNGTTRKLATIA